MIDVRDPNWGESVINHRPLYDASETDPKLARAKMDHAVQHCEILKVQANLAAVRTVEELRKARAK